MYNIVTGTIVIYRDACSDMILIFEHMLTTLIWPPIDRALASFSRTAAVTGKLEVRLMGCQDLIEDVPGQQLSLL
jgi:hypothetical protein